MQRACSGSIQKFSIDIEATAEISSFIMIQIASIATFHKQDKPLMRQNIFWIKNHILENHPDFSLEDIRIFTESTKMGNINGVPYGKVYGAVSAAQIVEWLRIYNDQKITVRSNLRKQEAIEAGSGHTSNLVQALTERPELPTVRELLNKPEQKPVEYVHETIDPDQIRERIHQMLPHMTEEEQQQAREKYGL